MDTAGDDDDPRLMELETLEAIYPEIRHALAHPLGAPGEAPPRFTFELELPVDPAEPVTILFPAPSSGLAPDERPGLASASAPAAMAAEPLDSLLVSHLPPLSLRITLPDGYPSRKPPAVTISTTPQWLPRATLRALEDDGARLWEEAGRDMVAYAYIDHLQRGAENVFGAVGTGSTLEVDAEHKLAVLDHDINAKKAAFDRETFECGICLDPKKGPRCHKMMDCGHIFCLQCLRDFYADAIEEGNLSAVRCVTPNCARARATSSPSTSAAKGKPKVFISPSELLQIGLPEDLVKRYVTLKYKTELEADKNTVYCPRRWCNGAARSKRHRKPQGLEFAESSGDETPGTVTEDGAAHHVGEKTSAKKFDAADLLAVCEDCGFAFCSRCLHTWHGEFVRCAPKRNNGELAEEEKASLEYLQLHTSPCPTCNAHAQKTHGCNHMICSRCDTHFCYLCSAWLDPANPYKHFNTQSDGKVTSCYMRLWELEAGDGDDVGLGYAGGREAGGVPVGGEHLAGIVPEVEEPESDDDSGSDNEADNEAALEANPRAVAVAREAPLVLRLMDNQPPQPPPPPPPPPRPAPAARGRGQAHHRPQGRGRAQHHHPVPQGAPHRRGPPAPRAARGHHHGAGRGNAAQQDAREAGVPNAQPGALDPAQEAWVRRFVQLALLDVEDQVEGGDSDSDDGNWQIR
ncbi:RING finger protein [Metarhizium album ARSEF 1941]|uniref:RBR-type E3 ubiquitin transferase n=1 Tax=Metarhizium album (strain ARSEF 1941) TaxID=1081103 RepID=A0A0B2WKW6_METAS|nr:RING finger protein [Metarhizium album ARSEF 1941]KHN94132.1 RING finger protein [Metarhizium album ARSEF 1941]